LEEINCPLNQLVSLDASNLPNLKSLFCHYNKLANLKIGGCDNLTKLSCSHNLLTSVDFLAELPNKEKLTHLDISDNSIRETKGSIFVPQDLKFLEEFINLKYLYLGN